MCCKTYCLTFQKQLFCTVKQALLHAKIILKMYLIDKEEVTL